MFQLDLSRCKFLKCAGLLVVATLLGACTSQIPTPIAPTAIVPALPVEEATPTVQSPSTATPLPTPPTSGKQALFVIFDQFEEYEYGVPRALLEDKGVRVVVAFSSLNMVKGSRGKQIKPDITLSNVHAADYDAIVFIGGYNYDRYNPETYRIAQEAIGASKVLAAICVAPITLAKAGVLKGKRATASLSGSMLEAEGAIYTGKSVERDGLIITANGPGASRQFGEAIIAALENE